MDGTTGSIPAILVLKKVYGFKLLVDEAHPFLSLGSTGRGSFNYWQDLGYHCSLKEADMMACMFSNQLAVEGRKIALHGSEKLSTAVITVDGELYERVKDFAHGGRVCSRLSAVGFHPQVLAAGSSALKRLEQRLADLYPSLARHSGRCRAMVCGDAEGTIGSSFAARAITPRTKHVQNLVLLASSVPHFVHKAVDMARESSSRHEMHFDTIQEVPKLLAQKYKRSKHSTHLTIYFEAVDSRTGTSLALVALLRAIARLSTTELAGACIFLDDRNGLGKIGPGKLGYLNHMEQLHGEDFIVAALGPRSSSVQVLVAGSWYNAFGHQGGYV
ncbi:hypothetical protein ED733_005715 [Metarhizium rileyi]|uniref:Aminotransferase class I/classII domain-containing protein n=1 Tax=Metarhizium rileyi (strain RCEF 4871) TaxID=1649241 RepID=A0A5C6GNW1_METRR|nr:hypothetical protein ED733_005715 [Metarhizium rileyi]